MMYKCTNVYITHTYNALYIFLIKARGKMRGYIVAYLEKILFSIFAFTKNINISYKYFSENFEKYIGTTV